MSNVDITNPQTGQTLEQLPSSGQALAVSLATNAQTMLYNGASSDLAFNNTQGVLVPFGARTVAPAIAVQTNPNHRGVLLYLNVTAAGTGGLTVTLRAIDPVSGTAFVALLTGALVTGPGIYSYQMYPGLPNPAAALGALTLAQNGALPRVWGANVAHADASAWTYSLAASLVL